MRSSQLHTQRGFNLIEAAIVLGVVGLVIGGIWVAAAAVQENMRLSRAQSDVIAVVSNIRRVFTPSMVPWNDGVATYNSDVNTNLNAQIFPANALSGTAPINPWGLRYIVDLAAMGSAASYVPTVTIYVLVPDASVCSQFGQRLYAAIKNEKDAAINIAGDGSVGDVDPDVSVTVSYCQEAYEASEAAGGDMLYLAAAIPL